MTEPLHFSGAMAGQLPGAPLGGKYARLTTLPVRGRSGGFMSADDKCMNTHMLAALEDPVVNQFLRRSLLAGYHNMQLPKAEGLVSAIMTRLEGSPTGNMGDALEDIRTQLSSRWVQGTSVMAHWSAYYRDHEAPFITSRILPHVEGERILEVGTGRGWISYHMAKSLGEAVHITQTDVFDYRESIVKEIPSFVFQSIEMDDPLPFDAGSFDTVVVVYVLHHHPDGQARRSFLEKLSTIARKRVIIFEDTYMRGASSVEWSVPQMDLIDDFMRLSDQQKINALAFQCSLGNRVDGGGRSVPTPCVFRDFDVLTDEFRRLPGVQDVFAEFLGIPKSKVYLNTEGLFVLHK